MKDKTLITLFLVVLFIFVLITRNDWLIISSMYILCGALVFIYRFNLLHPLVIFPIVFTLYSTAYPILMLLNIEAYKPMPLSNNVLLFEGIALVAYIISSKKELLPLEEVNKNKLNAFIMKNIFVIFTVISVLNSIIMFSNGIASRREVLDNQSFFQVFAGMLQYAYILIVMLIQTNKHYSKKENYLYIIIGLITMIIAYGVSGERSLVLNYILCVFLIYTIKNKLDPKIVIGWGLFLVIILTFSSDYRMFLISGATDYKSTKTIIQKFLMADFSAASFNFNQLLVSEDMWTFQYGKTLIRDVLGSIPIIAEIGNTNEFSGSYIYNQIFYDGNGHYGFSMVAEGYMNFGVVGIALWYFMIAKLISYLYKNAMKSSVGLVRYVFALSLALLSNRGTLESILSPYTKYAVIFVSIILLVCNKYPIVLYKSNKEVIKE